MTTLSGYLSSQRKAKNISTAKAARDLLIKKEILEDLEEANWQNLPEPALIAGFVKNYASYLNLDPHFALALFRREYDAKKYPQPPIWQSQKTPRLTAQKLKKFVALILVAGFVIYLLVQYLQITKAPPLAITSPPEDMTTTISAQIIWGKTERGAAISINGELVPVDSEGNFSHQYVLKEGQNTIEVTASKRLSPKTKITRTIRLSR